MTEMAREQRANMALAVLRSSLIPSQGQLVKPPGIENEVTAMETTNGMGNWKVDDSALIGEKVSTRSGLLLWLPNRGAMSMWRMGVVNPSGSNTVVSPTGTKGLTGRIGSVITGLNWVLPVALPYNNTDQITFAPDLSTNFSRARLTSGVVKLGSNTVPIGNFAFTGTLSAGSLTDTRDAAQDIAVGGTAQGAFTALDLVSQSLTQKDGLKEVPLDQGITCLLGPDIAAVGSAPNADSVVGTNGLMIPGTGTPVTSLTTQSLVAYPNVSNVGTLWVSPWGVTATPVAALSTTFMNYNPGPINECGSLRLHFDGVWNGTTNATASVNVVYANFALILQTTHVYAVVGSNGAVQFTVHEDEQLISMDQTIANTPPASQPRRIGCLVDCNVHPRSFVQQGKYVGTLCRFTVQMNVNGANWSGGFTSFAWLTVLASASTLNEHGELGPARVIRWEDVSDGQVLRCDAILNAQVTATGRLAPYLKDAAWRAETSVDAGILPLMANLYNYPSSPFRRCWVTREYVEFVRKLMEEGGISTDKLLEWTPPNSGTLRGGLEAAGLFQTAGSNLGSYLGNAYGGTIGGALGGFAGGLADKLFGTDAAGNFLAPPDEMNGFPRLMPSRRPRLEYE